MTPKEFFDKVVEMRRCQEVLEYVKEHTPDMFEPEGGYACMSLFHGLCE